MSLNSELGRDVHKWLQHTTFCCSEPFLSPCLQVLLNTGFHLSPQQTVKFLWISWPLSHNLPLHLTQLPKYLSKIQVSSYCYPAKMLSDFYCPFSISNNKALDNLVPTDSWASFLDTLWSSSGSPLSYHTTNDNLYSNHTDICPIPRYMQLLRSSASLLILFLLPTTFPDWFIESASFKISSNPFSRKVFLG